MGYSRRSPPNTQVPDRDMAQALLRDGVPPAEHSSPHPSCLYPCQNTLFKRAEEVNKALPKHELCSACPQ